MPPVQYPYLTRGSPSNSSNSTASSVDTRLSPCPTLEKYTNANNSTTTNNVQQSSRSLKSWFSRRPKSNPPSPPASIKSSRPITASLKDYGECYRRLGEGTTAIVMVVRKLDSDGHSEKLYAIKQFRNRKKAESEKEYMKKLTGEFCISSTFSHPNIVRTIDLVLDDRKRYCTVMEYCPGGDLFTSIMADRMTEAEKGCCFKQLVQGLAYLHQNGVAHRDIKPENLLLTMDGKIKITDFGVSDVYRFAWEKDGHKSRGVIGSEPYIAPEAFTEKEYWGAAADVWSAGIVLYCIYLGGMAWHKAKKSDSAYAVFSRTYATQQFQLFQRLIPGARTLLYRILDPNPDTRITADEILQDPWIKSIDVCDQHHPHNHTVHTRPVATLRKTIPHN
ncbi:kinase-like domain-containing protein [Phycomyces blakesleeanus]|uniref:Kinase-like domain-containing protein n=2 Tax=Phycomyces blakesleeanus TaxID=4837 RepID=A0ABR3B257_PHYBL